MKIGLLLGSFNPITIAHVSMAAAVINTKLCDKVLFVVAKHNPWKKEEPVSFDLRCKMVEAAIKPLGNTCEVCRLEEGVEPPVYSYIPITMALEKYMENDLFLIAGSDTIKALPNWKNFKTHIKDKIGIIEISRGNKETYLGNSQLPFEKWMTWDYSISEKAIDIVTMQRMDVSSTMVRNIIKIGMIPYPYVTQDVYNIIHNNNLYR